MDTRYPHDIKHEPLPTTTPAQKQLQAAAVKVVAEGQLERDRTEARERRWLPLTEQEAKRLESMTPDQRAEWLARLPFVERLRRFTKAEEEQAVAAKTETSQ